MVGFGEGVGLRSWLGFGDGWVGFSLFLFLFGCGLVFGVVGWVVLGVRVNVVGLVFGLGVYCGVV